MALAIWSGAVKLLNCVQLSRLSLSYLCTNGRDKQCYFPQSFIVPCNMYSSDVKAEKTGMGNGTGLNPKKKKVFVPRITLLSEDDQLSIVTMEMAEKIAVRRSLKLVKIVDYDTKTERPTYKLMTTKNYIQEGSQRKVAKKIDKAIALKPEKLLSISSKIAEHDLLTKIKSITKLLEKKHEIRVLISADGNKEQAAAIGAQVENAMKELPVLIKKSLKGGNVRIYLCPDLKAITKDTSNDETKDNKAEPPVDAGSSLPL